MREPLLTQRLILRDITEADAQFLFELDADPEVMRYIGPRPASDVAAYRERIRTVHVPGQAHPWHGVRVVLDRAGGEFLGWVFIRPAPVSRDAPALGWTRNDEVEVGYRYRRAAWGRGLATESAMPLVHIALTDPATSAIVACAHAGNTGSLRVLEKLGLKRIGEVLLPETSDPLVKLARVK
jgi:RimJ/RimL family protein N-acetyltransferase